MTSQDIAVRRRLLAGQAALFLVTVLTAVVAIVVLETTTRSADRVAMDLASDIALADQLRLDAERVVTTSRGYLLTGEQEYRTHLRELEVRFDGTLARLSIPRLGHQTAQIGSDALAYIAAVREAAERRSLANDPRAILAFFVQELKPRRVAFEQDVDALVRLEREDFEAARRRAHELARHAQLTIVVTSALALALGIGLSLLFTRALARQFRSIKEAMESARHAASSREDMVNIVSHDLRTPLQSIQLAIALLREPGEKLAREQRCLDTIDHASAQMSALIHDLLDTARVELGEFELHRVPCDAVALVREALELFQLRATEQGVALRSEGSGSFRLHADRARVLQVFTNLIGNALRFVPPGGTVTLRVARRGREIRFDVADTGTGIPAEQLPHVFDRYYQGERHGQQGGLGLGLHICRKLVEAHHGRLGVDSVPGAGCTFWFALPSEPASLT